MQNSFDLDTARGSCQLEITPNNRLLTQEAADKSSYSDARSSPGNKAEGRGGVVRSSGGDDPRFCVPHTEHEVLHGRGLGKCQVTIQDTYLYGLFTWNVSTFEYKCFLMNL